MLARLSPKIWLTITIFLKALLLLSLSISPGCHIPPNTALTYELSTSLNISENHLNLLKVHRAPTLKSPVAEGLHVGFGGISAHYSDAIEMSIQQGKVKSVSSGDTLVLTPLNNGRLERTLGLAYVTAPRMRREEDEVCLIPLPQPW